MKFLYLVAFASAVCSIEGVSQFSSKSDKNNRQKRLILYDNQGQLMKSYGNILYNIGPKVQDDLFQWSFLNTFLSPIFPTTLGKTSIAYMIPVSDAVVQEINRDPIYQNKILYLTHIDPLVQANPLCNGKRTQIPSPTLCNNYLNCWDGWSFEQECPAGLLFSNEGFCDYPNAVDCKSRKLKRFRTCNGKNGTFIGSVCQSRSRDRDKTEINIKYTDPNPLCNKDFEATMNPANCNEFFVCVNSIPVRFKCPAELAFSESLGVCDFPIRVECNNTADTPAPPPPVTQLSTPASPVNVPVTPDVNLQASTSSGDKKNYKMEYNTQTWSSTHVAISRQDAIRQLKFKSNDITSK